MRGLRVWITFCFIYSVFSNSIKDCPTWQARPEGAKDVTDLRPEDISVIASLGDSIMAGYAAVGLTEQEKIHGNVSRIQITEARGKSYIMGGDPGTLSFANFLSHYAPGLQGASKEVQAITRCQANDCQALNGSYQAGVSEFNAALSGAMSVNLDHELDYLIPEMKSKLSPEVFREGWKLITLQIGGNEQCRICDADKKNATHPLTYRDRIESAILRLQREVPRVVINLLGTYEASKWYTVMKDQGSYCPFSNRLRHTKSKACSCVTEKHGAEKADLASKMFNQQLEVITKKYVGKPGGTFAVMYSPAPVDLTSFPVQVFSDLDCFHPNEKGHQWMAKVFWNQLFTPRRLKPTEMLYSQELEIHCPSEEDRFPTTGL
ncbi:hypothetical protein BY458DRAFT_485853 [Sporodiniella umbellata]|nr:hypothetical protein BY458DRAFT_485853 [Sporodiniella umbellata]